MQFRDRDFDTYQELDASDFVTENMKLKPSILAKLRAGKMFTIDYRRYSNSDGGFYRLDGGIPTGEIDSQSVNGFIIFDDGYLGAKSNYEIRRGYAEADLKTYTEWANGEVYGWTLETTAGEQLEGCWGYIGDIENAKADAERTARHIKPASYAKNARELHR